VSGRIADANDSSMTGVGRTPCRVTAKDGWRRILPAVHRGKH